MRVSIEKEQVLELEKSLALEYLLTNGNGGYASSSMLDCHRRRYHGLLVLSLGPSGDRFNLLSKLDVSVKVNGKDLQLATNKFPGVYYPTGHQFVEHFDFQSYPCIRYKIGDIEVTKSVVMPEFKNTILVRYELTNSSKSVLLKAMPFLAYRKLNSLSRENIYLRQRTYFERNGFKVEPYAGLPPLYIQTSRKSSFYPAPLWWNKFEYIEDRDRGDEYQEDLFSPGVFEVKLRQGESVIFRASLDKLSGRISDEYKRQVSKYQALDDKFDDDHEPLKTLKRSARVYIKSGVKGGGDRGIIAGYHWFDEWGRDTLISLPGLTLCTGDAETALDILIKYAGSVKDGLLPNQWSADGRHSYNSIDTSLLFFWAAQHFIAYTGAKDKVRRHLLGAMGGIVHAFVNGEVDLAEIGADGLLYAGNARTQLTWMDAQVDGIPVTSRHGAAVELNALWYNAICFLLDKFSDDLDATLGQELGQLADLFRENFLKAFWNEEKLSLNDVYRKTEVDNSIRPNQLFALGLPYSCVDSDKGLEILDTVEQHLVTPFGLRSLSPTSSFYKSHYRGGRQQRDMAYHQGPVWPWLVGIYCDSLLKYNDNKKEIKRDILNTFKDLYRVHLAQHGLLHISEIFDSFPPYTPAGCIAQAWNLGELIRVLDIMDKI